MKKKLISIFTIATLLVTSISTVSLASGNFSDARNSKAVQTNKELDKEKGGNKGQGGEKEVRSVVESVYGNTDTDKEKDNDDKDDFKKANVNNVTVAIYTYGESKTPAEVVDILLNNNIPLGTIAKAVNRISDNHGDKYSELSESALDAYSEVILAKIESEKVAIQDRINSLEELTDLYDKVGDLEKAINIQKKAIMSDYKNILSYKKIGTIFNKKGDKDIKVFTVGEQVYFKDVKPVIKSDRTLVPIRAISESLKADVKWDEATQTVTITKDGVEIKLVLGNATAIINGQEVKLDAPAETLNNRTMVPVRFISEAFKSTVEWEPEHQIVIIY